MRLLFASTNQGKKQEVTAILKADELEIVTLDQLDVDYEEVEETGSTFKDNALLKAAYFFNLTNLPTLADDSGLEVDALDGAPGVHSNRWHPGSDDDRNNALLEKLKAETNRKAKFVTVACYHHPSNNITEFFRGEIPGEISTDPSGSAGFGYDPIFVPEGYDKPFAALGMDVKNKLSHRANAYQKVKEFLESQNLI